MEKRDTKLLAFNSRMLRTRQDVLDVVNLFQIRLLFENDSFLEGIDPDALMELSETFSKKLTEADIPGLTKPWLFYEFQVKTNEIVLTVHRCHDIELDERNLLKSISHLPLYNIIEVESRYVTVEQFARMHDVSDTTVRQWIRRGKLRDAKKQGQNWMIPSTAKRPHRGYEFGEYTWDKLPGEILEAFPFLEDSEGVFLEQDKYESDCFCATPKYHNEINKTIQLSTTEREKLELMLMASPDVSAANTVFISYLKPFGPLATMSVLPKEKVEIKAAHYSGVIVRQRGGYDEILWSADSPGDSFLYEERSPYLIPFDWSLRAIPKAAEEDVTEFIYNQSNAEVDAMTEDMGRMHGHFIMCGKLEIEGYDTFIECDNQSGELCYVIEMLTKEGAPLNAESGNPYLNVFYISEFEIKESFQRMGFGSRILREIPYLCRKYFYEAPDIIVYTLSKNDIETLDKPSGDKPSGDQPVSGAPDAGTLRTFIESNGFMFIEESDLIIAYVDLWRDTEMEM